MIIWRHVYFNILLEALMSKLKVFTKSLENNFRPILFAVIDNVNGQNGRISFISGDQFKKIQTATLTFLPKRMWV